MRNGARTCHVLSLSMSVLLLTSVSAQDTSNVDPRKCTIYVQNGDNTEYYCSEIQLTTQNDKTAAVNCNGSMLDCSKLPTLNFGQGGELNVLKVERCAVDNSLQCILTQLNATSIRRLYLNQQQTPVTEETVRGLTGLQAFYIFSSGAQKVVPVESLKLLPSLYMLRLNNVGLTDIPANTFFDADQPIGQSLTYLDISLNNITYLQGDSFVGLPKLTNLTFFKNNIHYVDVNTFKGLGGLLSLDVADESISTLPPGLFSHTPRLVYLAIPRNLEELHLDVGVISSLAHLEELTIKDAKKLVLGHLALSNLKSLTRLNLSGSDITELPEDVFLDSNAVTSLDLQNNKLSYLPEKLFSGMHQLRELRLSSNRLENVTRKMFESMMRIEEIYLDSNLITSLPDALFSSSHLRVLSLARNRIEDITEHSFQGSSSLESLDLSHNHLSWDCRIIIGSNLINIDNSVLANLSYLKALDLSYNNIQSICSDWMHVMISLQDLNLSNNRLNSISSFDLNFLTVDLNVNFENNSITTVANNVNGTLSIIDQNYIKQFNFKLGYNPFNCDCHLYNLLRTLDKSTFDLSNARCSQPPSLEHVSLQDIADQKRLDSLTCSVDGSESCECLFRPNQHRIECSCTDTRNITLPESTFDEIREMKLKLLKLQPDLTRLPSFVTELDLSGLGLKSIPTIPDTVRELDLRNNSLEVIPSEVLNNFKTLMLQGNPLRCDCSHIGNVRNLNSYQTKISNYNDLMCSDGASVEGKDLNTLCDVYYSTVIGVSCLVAAVILAVVIVLMYKFLPEVQVILFHIGLKRIVREEWIDKGKIFDIFLSYTVKDQHFVNGILLPKLEEMNYKVCEHTRDWEIGMQIPEQIYTSVANSKKTLFVISENFMKSVWVLEEFNATILQGAKDRTNRAVVIILDDVNLDEAPITIKRHLALNTYIKWDATNKSFWTKLNDALPKKLNAKEIKKRQKAVKAVKALGTGLNVVLNDDGKLVNIADVKKNVSTPLEITA